VAIVQGLAAGDNVVVAGQFLIDSEANLRAGMERLEATP
jgi:Cu(I)/Ag(I) efflux system membrane fusion protein